MVEPSDELVMRAARAGAFAVIALAGGKLIRLHWPKSSQVFPLIRLVLSRQSHGPRAPCAFPLRAVAQPPGTPPLVNAVGRAALDVSRASNSNARKQEDIPRP